MNEGNPGAAIEVLITPARPARILTGCFRVIGIELRRESIHMKPILALVAFALTALLLEDKARQVAGEARDASRDLAVQVSDAKKALSGQVERQPLLSLLVAGGAAYVLAAVIPRSK